MRPRVQTNLPFEAFKSLMTWKLSGINHVGLAPKDPAKAIWFLRDILGLSHLGDEVVGSQQTLTSMFRHNSPTPLPGAPRPYQNVGAQEDTEGQRLEVLAPNPPDQGPIAKFLDKKGSGIHHIALTVDRLEDLIKDLLSKSIKMIDETPRPGAHGTMIAFVHPESTGGLLIEFVQEPLRVKS